MVCTTDAPDGQQPLTGEIFGLILVLVVIATNVVSIAITYMIMRRIDKKTQSQRPRAEDAENGETFENAHTPQNRDETDQGDETLPRPNLGTSTAPLYDIPEGCDSGNLGISHGNGLHDEQSDDFYEETGVETFSRVIPPEAASHGNRSRSDFDQFGAMKMTSLPVASSIPSERHRNYLALSDPGNIYDDQLSINDDDEYEECDSSRPRLGNMPPRKKKR